MASVTVRNTSEPRTARPVDGGSSGSRRGSTVSTSPPGRNSSPTVRLRAREWSSFTHRETPVSGQSFRTHGEVRVPAGGRSFTHSETLVSGLERPHPP